MNANGKTLKCCGIGNVKFIIRNLNLLIIDEKLLDYNFFHGLNAITEFGREFS